MRGRACDPRSLSKSPKLMRIVSGKYRRRLLQTSPGETTRPITDRAKVALFDRIQPLLDTGPRVADVFSGTGTMGLEALSRGAKSVVFFEQDLTAYELLKQNVEMLGAKAETVCWRTDVFRTSFHPKGEAYKDFVPYDVIFFDPPYRMTPKIKQNSLLFAALERLGNPVLCAPEALLVLRCDEHANFELPPAWQPDEIHRVNRMMLHFHRFRPPAPVVSEVAATPVGGQ